MNFKKRRPNPKKMNNFRLQASFSNSISVPKDKTTMASISKRKRNRVDRSLVLQDIRPLTDGQTDTFEAFKEGYNLILHGSAGTGKSYLSLYLALKELMADNYAKIFIVRSAVPSRDQGFLPGTLQEKSAVFEAPYKAICNKLFGSNAAYDTLKETDVLEFMTTSYNRGITIDNAIIIVEECQNFKFEELDTIITRCGNNCRMIFNGDTNQTDLFKKDDKSGLAQFAGIIQDMDEFEFIEFGIEDIVRSGLVKSYLTAKYKKYTQKEL